MAVTTPTVWLGLAKANVVDAEDPNSHQDATNEQSRSKVIGLADGGFFLTWEDWAGVYNAGLEPRDITARIFDPVGTARVLTMTDPNDDTIIISTYSEFNGSHNYNDLDQQSQAIAQSTNGDLLVAYQSSDATGVGDQENIDVSIFQINFGTLQNPEQGHLDFREFIQNPQPTFANDTTPAITALSNGRYVVIYARDASGNNDLSSFIVTPGVDINGNPTGTKGAEVIIENSTDDATLPDAVTLTNGNFVVAYQSSASAGDIAFTVRSGTDASLVAAGTAATGASAQTAPQIAALTGGGFVIAWNDAAGDGASNAGVKAKLYTAAGTAVSGSLITLNTSTEGAQSEVAITQLADGGFLAVWTDDVSNSVKGQRFNATGTKIGTEFTAAALNDVSQPDLALMSDGRVVLSVTNNDAGNKNIYTTILDPRETVNGTNNADKLHSRKDGATVNALAGDDELIGYSGADALKGGTGSDTMTGGNGNDSYFIDVSGDRAIETNATTAGGKDTVYSALSSYAGGQSGISDAAVGSYERDRQQPRQQDYRQRQEKRAQRRCWQRHDHGRGRPGYDDGKLRCGRFRFQRHQPTLSLKSRIFSRLRTLGNCADNSVGYGPRPRSRADQRPDTSPFRAPRAQPSQVASIGAGGLGTLRELWGGF